MGSGGPNVELWVTGMDGALWDLGFGVEWTNGGHMGPGWDNIGLRDEWVPMGSGIWGRVAPKWRYGSQGWMGPYGMWDLWSGGPKMDGGRWDEWVPMGCGIWGRVDQR